MFVIDIINIIKFTANSIRVFPIHTISLFVSGKQLDVCASFLIMVPFINETSNCELNPRTFIRFTTIYDNKTSKGDVRVLKKNQ